MVRNIPCRYYDYIDPIKGTEKTIGFIAQEVREHFPQAVKIGVNEIPSVMKELTSENSSWEDLSSENDEKFRLTYHDLSNNLLDQEYVFYSYDISNGKITNEERIQIITEPNKFNSFLFTKKFDNLFCYGKMVDDFHSIEKGKIFTLHHSAIQELDKQRQADKAEITELKAKNTELETKLTTLESTLETVLARLTELENTPTDEVVV